MTLHLDDTEVRDLLCLEDLIPAIEKALIDLSAGRVVQPLRSVMEIPAQNGLFFQKPALIGDALGTKLLTVIHKNAERGLPTHLATIILMDSVTGETRAVMDGTWITELRTAAVSAVASKVLAAPNAQVLTLLGSGALARTHAMAIPRVRDITEIRVWSRTPAHVAACAEEIGGVAVATAEEAVRDADIVCTVTSATEPVLKGAWLKPGVLVNAVGAARPNWRELDDDVMKNIIIADQREAALQESGDVIGAGADIYAEIGELLCGDKPPPVDRTIVFKALGQAVEDVVAAQLVYSAAMARSRRNRVSLDRTTGGRN